MVPAACQTPPPNAVKNFVWKSGRCIRIGEEHCEPGFTLKDGQCVSVANPDCGDLVFNGKAGVHGKPICPEATYLDGERCSSIHEPQCPQGFKFDGEKCSAYQTPQCPSGSDFDKATQDCISTKTPECPSNQRFNGKHCAIITGQYMEFEYCPTESYEKECRRTPLGVACDGVQSQKQQDQTPQGNPGNPQGQGNIPGVNLQPNIDSNPGQWQERPQYGTGTQGSQGWAQQPAAV
ncbi:hypothetical protein PMG11_05026 [Penicillium brasilianum]|uniref:Oocyst wall protein n=1 Tax=Penicillium brasilianum TaxID=104259 RepID=A0A0F7VJV3_PENBI|nr:hypothetical protein PMG11_05026 [Penicillium brasilianum]